MSIAIAFILSMAGSACWLRAVTKLTGGRPIPISDLLLITGLCSGLALLPGPGWALAITFMALLTTKAEHLDFWPDVALMLGGSAVIWLFSSAWLLF